MPSLRIAVSDFHDPSKDEDSHGDLDSYVEQFGVEHSRTGVRLRLLKGKQSIGIQERDQDLLHFGCSPPSNPKKVFNICCKGVKCTRASKHMLHVSWAVFFQQYQNWNLIEIKPNKWTRKNAKCHSTCSLIAVGFMERRNGSSAQLVWISALLRIATASATF